MLSLLSTLALASLFGQFAGTAAAGSTVPCSHATGSPKYYCSFYPAGDGIKGGAEVLGSDGGHVGFLNQGSNYVYCQQVGRTQRAGANYNYWWAYTKANDLKNGWVNAVYAHGGSNNGKFGGGVPSCGGSHGSPPHGATPAPTPHPQPKPPSGSAVPCSHATGSSKYYCSFYPAGDGIKGGAPVLGTDGRRVGYLNQGRNYVYCQQIGRTQHAGASYNYWWAYTKANDLKNGWVDAVYAHGGSNNGKFGGGVPSCGGKHGSPPHAPAPPPTHPKPPPTPRYAALGDSFSSGEGAGSYFGAQPGRPQVCDRSQNAYAQILGRRLASLGPADRRAYSQQHDFLACSGATIPDMLRNQVPRIGSSDWVVTVSIGGNDAGFSTIIKECMLDAVTHPIVGGKGCDKIIDEHFKSGLPKLRTALVNAYRAIRNRAPLATVIVLGYPSLFEDGYSATFCASVGALTRGARSNLRVGAKKLDATIASAAKTAGVRFVDPTSKFNDHRVCSSGTDWINGLIVGQNSRGTFHPNKLGQAAFATIIENANHDIFG